MNNARVLYLFYLGMIGISCDQDPATLSRDISATTLLISMDGFRYDYLDSANTPNFDLLEASGAKAEGLIPVFPSKTFPNHYSIVTGLYPENHGIIANTMVDTQFQETFKIGAGSSATKEGKWFEGEPIWVTAEKQGIKTATYFWPGSDAKIQGIRPTYRKIYDNSVPYATRIAQVVDWMTLPTSKRPRLITLYFESPDKEGHLYGPLSEEVRTAVQSMDRYVGDIVRKLDAIGIRNQINILLLSDHGMTQLSRKRIIFLDDYIDLNSVDLINWSPVADIVPQNDPRDIYRQLKDAHPHLTVFLKDSVPSELHYQNHRRIAPVFAVADNGWTITSHRKFEENPRAFMGGTHGYRPDQKEMWAIFLASGPAFKKKVKISPFENIHIYELMCHLLSITPAANDGDLQVFEAILTEN